MAAAYTDGDFDFHGGTTCKLPAGALYDYMEQRSMLVERLIKLTESASWNHNAKAVEDVRKAIEVIDVHISNLTSDSKRPSASLGYVVSNVSAAHPMAGSEVSMSISQLPTDKVNTLIINGKKFIHMEGVIAVARRSGTGF